ncbi:glycosyltransferase family 4 protein [Flavobacteriales bacterium]|nr:glycosyltransferase family 4 protein [Flavobacteriales bacterium]
MNILLVIADLGVGGAQQVVINLANELVRQSHRVWIFDVHPEIRNEGMLERLSQKTYLISKNYSEVKLSFKEKIVDYFFNKLKIKTDNKKKLFNRHEENLQKILLNNKVDYVNSHVCWADFFVYEHLKSFHNKWIITLHASYKTLFSILDNKNKYFNLCKKTILSAKKIININDEGISFLEKELNIHIVNSKKIHNGCPEQLISNQVSRNSLNFKATDFIIFCASRAIREKGWYELCDAVLKFKNENIKLVFAGDGEILNEIKEKYSNHKSIIFLGFQNNILELINLSNIVCLPSYSEALPTILIEAIFLNKPTLATNVGEVHNILQNKLGKCGVLLKEFKGDLLVAEIYKGLSSFINNKVALDEKAFEEARDLFSLENMALKYLNYIKEK